ncbi:MAG: TonB-dependent receptor plug domain-containing protein [Bacteroidaceae bacterium]|nr:TonB-dependent receptor plug domain-containing protein [Bacteroidaceae bacterium]
MAQTSRGSYDEALELYNVGRVQQARDVLHKNWNKYNNELRTNAYRLMTLCLLEQDQAAAAEEFANRLLAENPYYTTGLDDPQRYVDLIARLKEGKATITTASQLAETVEEAPVPVVLITEEMIRESGARTLQDLLTLYVPGMVKVEGFDENVAMRGAYSMMQEKILVMLDGLRLNSHTTNSESLDQRISLEKVSQIEILRGPASSLYGNVALTAVINIKTKSGGDVNGIKVKGGVGTYGTYSADVLLGKRILDLDVMVWASAYFSNGERRECKDGDKDFLSFNGKNQGYYYLNNMRGTPAYDIGTKLSFKDFSFLFNMQQSRKTTVYSPSVTWGIYDFDRYWSVDGFKPGFTRKDIHTTLNYKHTWGKFTLNADVSLNWEQGCTYYVLGDSLTSEDTKSRYVKSREMDKLTDVSTLSYTGLYDAQVWSDFSLGALISSNYAYNIHGYKGTAMLGIQYDHFSTLDTYMVRGDGYDKKAFYLPESMRALKLGREYNVSGFAQWKQALPWNFLLNAGIRYDNKRQFDNRRRSAWSPRVALIYDGLKNTNIKFTYARSFVDAAYLYRANTTFSYMGGEFLDPEQLDACQLNISHTVGKTGLSMELTAFYNSFTDLVKLVGSQFLNVEMFKTTGLEFIARYRMGRHSAYGTFSWLHVLDASDYTVSLFNDKRIYQIPPIQSTIGYDVNLLKPGKYGKLNVNANVQINSSFLVQMYEGMDSQYYRDLAENDPRPLLSYDCRLPARAIVNAGLNYQYRFMELNANVYNLIGTDYALGSVAIMPTPQQRRTFMAKLSFKF